MSFHSKANFLFTLLEEFKSPKPLEASSLACACVYVQMCMCVHVSLYVLAYVEAYSLFLMF